VAKIKGTHNAMKSGIVAADSIYKRHCDGPMKTVEISEYEDGIKNSWVWEELYKTRNFKGGFKLNMYAGLVNGWFLNQISRGKEPWNLRIKKKDYEWLEDKIKHKEIVYPKHDGKLTFDLLSNLVKSGTMHEHDQPSHLRIKKGMEKVPSISYYQYGAPEEKFCPAKVYEFVKDENDQLKLQINAQNCLHCKACSIKMVDEYIDWNVPEGGGGPNYTGM